MATPPFSLLSSLPEEKLPHVLSYLNLTDVLRMRLVCANFRDIIFDSTHHLWMDEDEDEAISIPLYGDANIGAILDGSNVLSSRRMRLLLSSFPKLRSLRLTGLRLVYQSLVWGRNGEAANPRYICSLLQEAECAQNLECLELLDVSDSQAAAEVDGEWGEASPPSHSLHTDIRLEQLQKLKITMGGIIHRENPLVHSLLRASNKITHLTLVGCNVVNDYDIEEAILKPLANTLVHLDLSENLRLECPTIQSSILKTLILDGCGSLSTLNAKSFCPELTALDLSSCVSLEDVESGLTNFCPRLKTLKLRGCHGLRFVNINSSVPPTKARSSAGKEGPKFVPLSKVQSKHPVVLDDLECIDLSMCVHLESLAITSETLMRVDVDKCMHMKVISLSASALEELDLSGLPLTIMSLHCPNLSRLNLSRCSDLDSKRSIIKCNALESVDIRGATFITANFFDDPDRKCKLSIDK